jgi:hypothetical protein
LHLQKIIKNLKFNHFLLVVSAMSAPLQASAIDLQPGEIRAPLAGRSLVQFSTVYSQRSDYYVNSHKISGRPEYQALQYQLRLAHAFEIDEQPSIVYAQLPITNVQPQGSSISGDSGVGDTTFAFAYWPYANRETQTYFGIAAYLIAPTGSYSDRRIFNVGENRYRGALQLGVQTPIIDSLTWMAALDTVWSGKNNDCGLACLNHQTLEQKPLYTLQSGLSYAINPTFSLATAYFYSVGGETSWDGINKNNLTQLQRYQVSGIANFSFGRILLQYGGDLDTRNGYLEDSRWIVRYIKPF